MQAKLILVTGGARAGKSAFAEEWAQAIGGERVSFIATSQALDPEMAERIARHQAERPLGWQTIEEPLEVALALEQAQHKVVVLDCLTLWVSNLMLHGRDVLPAVENLLATWEENDKRLIVVSNEVGWGIVPDNALARQYRDWLGLANRRVAAEADVVYLLVAGVPVKVK